MPKPAKLYLVKPENSEVKPKKKRKKLPPNVVEKNGVWSVRKSVSRGGKQKQVWRVCEPPTAERAKELLAEIEEQIKFTASGLSRPLYKFSEIVAEFRAAELNPPIYENNRKIAGRRSIKTLDGILKTLDAHFGHASISEITFGDLETFKLQRLKTPIQFKTKTRPRSLKSVNYELAILRQVFNFAFRRRWLARSPFSDGKNLIDTANESRRSVIWTREEEAAALALCTDKLAHMKVVIILICDGGFRRGELLQAKWSDVDFENEVILAKSYKGKTFTARPVYMTERVKNVLLEWRREQKKIKVSDKSLIIGYGNVKNAWISIRNKIGRPDLRLHDMRRVFASRLHYEADVPISLVSKSLGHSNYKTTEIYISAATDDLRDAIKKLDR